MGLIRRLKKNADEKRWAAAHKYERKLDNCNRCNPSKGVVCGRHIQEAKNQNLSGDFEWGIVYDEDGKRVNW